MYALGLADSPAPWLKKGRRNGIQASEHATAGTRADMMTGTTDVYVTLLKSVWTRVIVLAMDTTVAL